jgi:hypothetical protein
LGHRAVKALARGKQALVSRSDGTSPRLISNPETQPQRTQRTQRNAKDGAFRCDPPGAPTGRNSRAQAEGLGTDRARSNAPYRGATVTREQEQTKATKKGTPDPRHGSFPVLCGPWRSSRFHYLRSCLLRRSMVRRAGPTLHHRNSAHRSPCPRPRSPPFRSLGGDRPCRSRPFQGGPNCSRCGRDPGLQPGLSNLGPLALGVGAPVAGPRGDSRFPMAGYGRDSAG